MAMGREIFFLFQSSPRHTDPPCKRVLLVGRRRQATCDCDEERTECSAMLWSGVTTSPGRKSSTMPCLSRWAVSPASRTPEAGWLTRTMAFHGVQTDRWQGRRPCQRRHDRLYDERCQAGRCMAQSRRRERRDVDRRPAWGAPRGRRADVSRLSSRSRWQQTMRALSHACCLNYRRSNLRRAVRSGRSSRAKELGSAQ